MGMRKNYLTQRRTVTIKQFLQIQKEFLVKMSEEMKQSLLPAKNAPKGPQGFRKFNQQRDIRK